MVIAFDAVLTLGRLLASEPEPEAAASGSLPVEL
jgi:hypothetical protein